MTTLNEQKNIILETKEYINSATKNNAEENSATQDGTNQNVSNQNSPNQNNIDQEFITSFAKAIINLEQGWQKQANCLGVNPNLFYPERGVSTSEAKAVCDGCEVKNECLEAAVERGEKFGIWGGLSERERREIRRERRENSRQIELEHEALPESMTG